MQLASGIGAGSSDALMDSLSEQEFQNWHAFNAICPIGPGRLDAAIGGFMAIVARYLGCLAGEKPDVLEEITPQSFLPWLPEDEDKPSPVDEEQQARMEAEAARVNLESQMIALAAARRGMQ